MANTVIDGQPPPAQSASKRNRDSPKLDEGAAGFEAKKSKKKTGASTATHNPVPKPMDAPLDFLSHSPWPLPTTNNRIESFDPVKIAQHALQTHVLLHPRLPELISSFLHYKREHGSKLEQDLYNGMNQHGLVARLIKKRPLHFVNFTDFTVLRDGTVVEYGHKQWLCVGTDEDEKNNSIHFEDYLSYDEMMLSFISVRN